MDEKGMWQDKGNRKQSGGSRKWTGQENRREEKAKWRKWEDEDRTGNEGEE